MSYRDHERTRHILSWLYTYAEYVSKYQSQKKKIWAIDMGRTQGYVENPINLTLKSKVRAKLGSCMYAPHRLMVIHVHRLIQSHSQLRRICRKSYKFDLEVKGQSRFVIMHVRTTSSHGDSCTSSNSQSHSQLRITGTAW